MHLRLLMFLASSRVGSYQIICRDSEKDRYAISIIDIAMCSKATNPIIQVYAQLHSAEMVMNTKIENYGVKATKRPKIVANKKLDLSGEFGQQIVRSETKLVLRTHKRTFQKLADM